MNEKKEDAEKRVLKIIGDSSKKYPLLSHSQEIELIRAYQDPLKALVAHFTLLMPREPKAETARAYEKRIFSLSQKSLLTKGTTYYNKTSKESLDALVCHNLRLCLNFARKVNGGTLTVYDLFVEGVRGLMHGIDKFDINKINDKGKPNKLSTYATWWVKQYIQRAIQDSGRTIRIPIHIHDQINKVKKAYGEWSGNHGDQASPDAKLLSELTGIDEEQVKVLGRFLFEIESTNEVIDDEAGLTVLDYYEADQIKYAADASVQGDADMIKLVKSLDKYLDKGEAEFIKLRWGLVDKVDRTEREMASLLQIKLPQVQKWEASIMNKLKNKLKPSDFNCLI